MAEPHESRVYSDLAHFYDAVFGWAFVDHEHEVLEALPFRPGHRVLEVGVGTGISLDAQQLEFADGSFDWVLSFHVITVVPDPRRMMDEMLRVCKPGGRIVLISHFASPNPLLFLLGSLINPVTEHLGWTTRLRARDVLDGQKITVERNERFWRLSFHQVIIARKEG